MKYCVENDLSLFDFHDLKCALVSFDGKDLVTSFERLNIRKDTEQNPSEYDMQIECAQVTFKGLHSVTYEPARKSHRWADGMDDPLEGREALDAMLEELQYGVTVYYFEKEADGRYSMGGFGREPYFTSVFGFDSVTVSWDEYAKKAWYELHRQYRFEPALQTPNGEETVQITVICHEEPVYYKGKLEQPPTVNVGCTFACKEYWGHGSDYLWIDAFADLQRQLPEGVLLKCCLTCRHGNLCPVGDAVNEVFCTKDVLITQKSDLYFYTEDDREREKRARQYCESCDDYQPQTDDFYTYNDYLYRLIKQ